MPFLFWIMMGVVVAIIASSKGKSGFAWFLYGALIWPIALVHILVTPADPAVTERNQIASGGKKCPKCAEIIKRDATVCRFCGHDNFPEFDPRIIVRGKDGIERYEMPKATLWQELWWKPAPPDNQGDRSPKVITRHVQLHAPLPWAASAG